MGKKAFGGLLPTFRHKPDFMEGRLYITQDSIRTFGQALPILAISAQQ
jgi:hypothetical protein